MPTVSEKLKNQSSAVPKKIMADDPSRLYMSYEQSIAKDKQLAEIDEKLEAEKIRLQALADEETKALEKAGSEDLQKKVIQEEV